MEGAAAFTRRFLLGSVLISGQTVNTHIKNMYRKLNVRTQVQAINLAAKRQIF
jgi:DNA-binding NarL/FixJ family response regulator